MIPIGREYYSTLTATTRKEVVCEHCRCEYAYNMTCTSHGRGISLLWVDNDDARERAQVYATRGLERMHRAGCELVPCPDCGWYQRDMVRKKRQFLTIWISATSIAAGATVAGWGHHLCKKCRTGKNTRSERNSSSMDY